MSRLAVLLAAATTIAGCGATHWPNADPVRNTQAAFNWDSQECREQSRYRNAHRRWGENPLTPYMVVDEERVRECMKARGWVPPRRPDKRRSGQPTFTPYFSSVSWRSSRPSPG